MKITLATSTRYDLYKPGAVFYTMSNNEIVKATVKYIEINEDGALYHFEIDGQRGLVPYPDGAFTNLFLSPQRVVQSVISKCAQKYE